MWRRVMQTCAAADVLPSPQDPAISTPVVLLVLFASSMLAINQKEEKTSTITSENLEIPFNLFHFPGLLFAFLSFPSIICIHLKSGFYLIRSVLSATSSEIQNMH